MMFTLMHISDLHRAAVDPITNSELMSALSVDREKIRREAPAIGLPDALIVSGDLIQGMPTNASDHSAGVQAQYAEARELLEKLANQFFAGNRSRIIIVPGNHDVDWKAARMAMRERDVTAEGISGKVYDLISLPGTKYRWDWRELKLWEIVDQSAYSARFSHFSDFVGRFYSGARLKFPFRAERDWNVFELADDRIIIAAFNSCISNDCFSQVGHIPRDAIADCHMAIQDTNPSALRIAVWHHNTEGPPATSDYLDTATVRLLIDKGFAIGLHGHQHKSEANPYTLFASGRFEMAVFSCGSLCAGSKGLPQGYNPQYNFVELDIEGRTATVHVREMLERGIFAQGRLNILNRASHFKVDLRAQPYTQIPNAATSGGRPVRVADEIEKLRVGNNYRDAIQKLDEAGELLGTYGRSLRLRLLTESADWKGVIRFLGNPESLSEMMLLVRAHIEERDANGAEEALGRAERRFEVPAVASSEFNARIRTLRIMNP